MGLEKQCTAVIGRKRLSGSVQLESAGIVFRSQVRLVIPFQDIRSVTARNGRLEIVHAEGRASFELGDQAARWAEQIRNPKGLLDKLGVKPGLRVAIVGIKDADFAKQLAERTDEIATERPQPDTDLVFFGLTTKSELSRLRSLRGRIKPNGAIWAVWPKGRPALREDDIRAAALAAGLVDVKVAAFSASHSALKLMIPVAQR